MVQRRVGNRFTGGTRLTDREAQQIVRYIVALGKLRKKKSRFVGEVREIEFIMRTMINLVEDADRGYVLTAARVKYPVYEP